MTLLHPQDRVETLFDTLSEGPAGTMGTVTAVEIGGPSLARLYHIQWADGKRGLYQDGHVGTFLRRVEA